MVPLILASLQLVIAASVTVLFVWYFTSEARSILAGAPYAPMPKSLLPELVRMAPPGPEDVFVDLGCGDGRVLHAALSAGAGRALGYDIAWWPLFQARRTMRPWGRRAAVFRRDIRTAPLTEATIVYMYLGTGIVDAVTPRLSSSLRSGSRIISAAFPIDTDKHSALRLIRTQRVGTINAYLYKRV